MVLENGEWVTGVLSLNEKLCGLGCRGWVGPVRARTVHGWKWEGRQGVWDSEVGGKMSPVKGDCGSSCLTGL